ncbi:Uncharacterised protein [Photobacterium damselae]|uniref:Uncharacterized protein n=1 Tax=Photobacterium damselae TaxID=38293 RepID=A0A2X1XT82_PHODM|nr:Uncharacterised protein [Photobacterium damselae]SPY46300.1 Uncharacterised protein [Photobacterium damselae]
MEIPNRELNYHAGTHLFEPTLLVSKVGLEKCACSTPKK